jgi:hypothetical protein
MTWLPAMSNGEMVVFTFFTWLVLMTWLKLSNEGGETWNTRNSIK